MFNQKLIQLPHLPELYKFIKVYERRKTIKGLIEGSDVLAPLYLRNSGAKNDDELQRAETESTFLRRALTLYVWSDKACSGI